jgi:hypothetical protein
MGDPWTNPPEGLDLLVQRYVRKAGKLNISPDLLAKYARILIAAEEVVAERERSEQSVQDETARVAAAEHGVYEDDPQKARKAYKAARQRQQALHNSATALAGTLAQFERVLKARHGSLQVEVADKFPLADILAASNFIREFAAATTPHPADLAEIKFAKSELSLTLPGHTFMWWRNYVPKYRGQWNDMYALARCWRLTDAQGLDTFQRRVKKLKPSKDSQGRNWILGCPPWAIR